MAGKTIDRKVAASAVRAFEACRRATAELGYSITDVSKESLTISFNTGRSMKTWGGQDLTASLFDEGDSTLIVVGGSLGKGGSALTGGGSQLFAWGEKKTLSLKFLDTVEALLPSIAESSSATSSNDSQPSSAADELLKLKELLDAGAISQEEFDNEKNKLLS